MRYIITQGDYEKARDALGIKAEPLIECRDCDHWDEDDGIGVCRKLPMFNRKMPAGGYCHERVERMIGGEK